MISLSIRRAYAGFARHRPAEENRVYDIFALHQDRIGFVWVGTEHGLIRLDSHHARRFTHDPAGQSGTPGRMIFTLGQDHEGDLMLGCFDGGCARFDSRLEEFIRIDHQPIDGRDSLIRFFQPMGDGRVWIGTNGSLTSIDSRGNSVRKYFHPDPPDPTAVDKNSFSSVCAIDDRTMLVGTLGGIVLVDTRTTKLTVLPCSGGGDERLHRFGVNSIIPWHDGFIAASARFLYHVDFDRGCLIPFDKPINRMENREYFGIHALAPDSVPGRFWIGTREGLLRMESDLASCAFFKPGPEGDATLHGPSIMALLRDRSNMLWIGTNDGLSLLDLRYRFDSHVLTNDGDSEQVIVRAIAQDHNSTLWLGTSRGLVEYDRTTGEHIVHSMGGANEQMRRANDDCHVLHMGSGTLWIGSLNGLFGWDPDACEITHVFTPPMPDDDNSTCNRVLGLHVDGIVEDGEGYVWSGSGVNGLQRLDPRTNTFRYYIYEAPESGGMPAGQHFASFEDRLGRLWFGFSSGLARFDRATDAFEIWRSDPSNPRSLSNDCVLDIFQDRDGRIWIGTAGGLNRLVEGADGEIHFERYGAAQGLPDEFVGAITESANALWCGVDPGVLRLRMNGSRLDVSLFEPSDGMVIVDRHQNAVLRDSSGLILYGGRHGFDQFDPDHLEPDTLQPPVVITSFKVFNREAGIREYAKKEPAGEIVLERAITHMREVILEHRHNVITIGYAALHYRQPERIRYQYRMRGFDETWIDAGSGTEATFTNLDPGSYEFQVRAINGDGVVSREPAELEIRVRPPLWRTWWAYGAYGTMATGAVAAFVRWRIAEREREFRRQRELERARMEEREEIRRQNAADFHDEAGTTLTRILLLIELARRQTTENMELNNSLRDINQNASRLAQGMRDFIWVLDPDKDTLLDTLQRIEVAGEELFRSTDVSFSMNYDHRELRDVVIGLNQRRQLLMICKEALHNAMRHGDPSSVLVGASRMGKGIIVTIEDDGRGFNIDDTSDGYGMKSMRRRAESMGARIIVESVDDTGTRIEIEIPHLGN